MNKLLYALGMLSVLMLASACDKDAGKLPNIAFKTGSNYISSNYTIARDSIFMVGITASKSESEDVLKKFNISRSINGGSSVSVLDKDLSGSDGNNYSTDYSTKSDSIAGQKNLYTFTVTNRDGLINQVSVTITLK